MQLSLIFGVLSGCAACHFGMCTPVCYRASLVYLHMLIDTGPGCTVMPALRPLLPTVHVAVVGEDSCTCVSKNGIDTRSLGIQPTQKIGQVCQQDRWQAILCCTDGAASGGIVSRAQPCPQYCTAHVGGFVVSVVF